MHREEYIEQAYFFRTFLERVGDYCVDELELFHTGLVSGVEKLEITAAA